MLFPTEESEVRIQENFKTIYVYENSCNNRKPAQIKIGKKKVAFRDLAKALKFNKLRLFNEEGAEYFDDDLQFVKNGTSLYASRGEDFDPTNCFGEYQIGDKLGEGGFGQVFLAHHKHTGEKCAIKIIKISSATDIDSIFVEAQILKSLKHENIVKVINCLTLKDMRVAIIMQYLEGGQLRKYVEKSGKLSQEVCRNFCRQIIKGIFYCHENNLIHRDLKLENILLVNSEQKKVKIIDFGIAGVMSRFTEEDLDTGSLGYMAPECFFNDKNYKFDGKMDVWAIGVTLFSMLVGELPFKGHNSFQIRENIKKAHYKIPVQIRKQLSKECVNVIYRCLDPNPKSRITASELMMHEWLSENNIFQKIKKQEQKAPIFVISECQQKPQPVLKQSFSKQPVVKQPLDLGKIETKNKSKSTSIYKPRRKKGKQNTKRT